MQMTKTCVLTAQAQTNITIAEAEAADASAKQWLQRQNIIGRSGGEPCKKQNYFINFTKPSTNKCVVFVMKQNKKKWMRVLLHLYVEHCQPPCPSLCMRQRQVRGSLR